MGGILLGVERKHREARICLGCERRRSSSRANICESYDALPHIAGAVRAGDERGRRSPPSAIRRKPVSYRSANRLPPVLQLHWGLVAFRALSAANRLRTLLVPPVFGRTTQENALTISIQPLLCSIPDAANALGVSRSKAYELISQGRLLTVHIGRRRLVQTESIRAIASGEAA